MPGMQPSPPIPESAPAEPRGITDLDAEVLLDFVERQPTLRELAQKRSLTILEFLAWWHSPPIQAALESLLQAHALRRELRNEQLRDELTLILVQVARSSPSPVEQRRAATTAISALRTRHYHAPGDRRPRAPLSLRASGRTPTNESPRPLTVVHAPRPRGTWHPDQREDPRPAPHHAPQREGEPARSHAPAPHAAPECGPGPVAQDPADAPHASGGTIFHALAAVLVTPPSAPPVPPESPGDPHNAPAPAAAARPGVAWPGANESAAISAADASQATIAAAPTGTAPAEPIEAITASSIASAFRAQGLDPDDAADDADDEADDANDDAELDAELDEELDRELDEELDAELGADEDPDDDAADDDASDDLADQQPDPQDDPFDPDPEGTLAIAHDVLRAVESDPDAYPPDAVEAARTYIRLTASMSSALGTGGPGPSRAPG